MPKQKPSDYFIAFGSLILFIILGYGIERHETVRLFLCYFSLFLLYLLVIRNLVSIEEAQVSFWISTALLCRAALLFSTPQLSDDVFRFIWDGRLLEAGHSPFAHVPAFYMQPGHGVTGLDERLFDKLNSQERFSSYPPVCQLFYWISVKLSPDSLHGSILVMKNMLFTFEIATILMLRKLLTHFNLPRPAVLIYALNPLVVLEITGNLHFEGIMIFFLIVSIWFLVKRNVFLSFTSFALSVSTKLIPLLFLPLLLHTLGWKKALTYWAMTAMIIGILFLPLLNEDITHGFSTSLSYYFQRFEFNASVYYLVRAIGYWIVGYNIIQFAGPLLALAATGLILYVALGRFKSSLSSGINTAFFEAMLWCLFIYFLSTTTLHPWYIITLLAISIFTNYRFPVVWTGAIFVTYAGYTQTSFQEDLLWVSLEYAAVIAYLFYETVWINRKSHFL